MITELSSIVNKCSTSICSRLRSRTKTALVWLLDWLLAWCPTFAMLLGQRIWRLLPWLTEA
jgi:hypothetical protein